MNSFETSLLRGIPLGEAADFFLRVRGKDKVAQAEIDAAIKEANAMAPGAPAPTPAQLPATAKGQNMQPQIPPALPPTAMGQQPMSGVKMGSEKSPEETGKDRARASLSAEFEKNKAHRSEGHGGMAGGTLGALAGGMAAHRLGKASPLATIAGAALGHHMGRETGRALGASADAKRHEKAAAAFKLALQDAGMAQAPTGLEPELDPATQEYLANEAAATEAAEQNQAEFLRAKLQEAQAELQAKEEQTSTLEQAQAMHDTQMQQIQSQVADSTSKAMAAQDQVLQQQQAAAAMRMAYQQLRGTLLQAASTEPPSLTPGATGADAAAAQMSQKAGPDNAPAPQSGPAGAAPNPGVPPAGMAPTGDDTVSTPAESNEPMFGNAQGTTKMEQQEPSGDAKTPNKEVLSHALPFGGGDKVFDAVLKAYDRYYAATSEVKLATLREYLGQQAGNVLSRLPHAAVGAAVGGGLAGAEALSSNKSLQKKVEGLEAKENRGLRDTLDLAQSRARLGLGEYTKKHPVAAIGAGALMGGLTGATEGPGLVSAAKGLPGDLRQIGKNVKDIVANRGAA